MSPDNLGVLWYHAFPSIKTTGALKPGGDWIFVDNWIGPALRVEGVPIPEPSMIALTSVSAVAALCRRN